jgi:hypothetical protein
MSPRRGIDFTFIHGVLAIRARAVARSKQPPPRIRTKRHDHTPTSPSTTTYASARLSLFGWQAHRQALIAPWKKKLDIARGIFASSPPLSFNFEPSAPVLKLPEISAPLYACSAADACAPPLTPTNLACSSSAYEPSAPLLTPTSLWTNVQWATP